MNPLSELPMGFGMALLQNQKSAQYFDSCTPERQAAILNQVHTIQSKKEMKDFVESLSKTAL